MGWYSQSKRSQGGSDSRAVQELLGHKDVGTTMIFTDVLNRGPAGARRPADPLIGRLKVVIQAQFVSIQPTYDKVRGHLDRQVSDGVRQARLTPIAFHSGAQRIAWDRGDFRRLRRPFRATTGRPACRVRGGYAGLPNFTLDGST